MPHSSEHIGPYILITKLGQGAYGEVWLAERRSEIITTKVAVKIPLDNEVDSNLIKREAALWVHASGHPNVLPIIEANIYDGRTVIVSEYSPDGSLAEWLSQHGGSALSVEKAIELAVGILAGLQHLHQREIVHRDLKPPNILLQGDTPRLADFGISRVLSTSRSGIIAGTPAYMAPEAFGGERNEQTDIWSAGVVLYELLSGRLPFPQSAASALTAAIINESPDPLPSSVPKSVQAVTIKALSKDPANRYLTAAEMRIALRDAEKMFERGRAEQTTIKYTEPASGVDPLAHARPLPWFRGNSLARKSVSRRILEALKDYFTIEDLPTEPKARDIIRNWSFLKSWTGDYKSSPSAWAFDGKTLAGFYNQGADGFRGQVSESRLYLWHIPTGVSIGCLKFQKGSNDNSVDWGAFFPDARNFVGGLNGDRINARGTWKNILCIWDTHTGAIVRKIKIGPYGDIRSLTFSPTGRYLAFNFSDQIKIWDFKKDSISTSFPSQIVGVSHLSFSPDERLLVGVGIGDTGLRVWNWKTGQLQFSALIGKSGNNSRPAFSPDASMLAATNSDHQIMVWDTSTNELVQVLDKADFDGSSLLFSPDGLTLACRCLGKEKLGLQFFDLFSSEMKILLDEKKEVCASTFSSDGNLLINWCVDKTITLWKAE